MTDINQLRQKTAEVKLVHFLTPEMHYLSGMRILCISHFPAQSRITARSTGVKRRRSLLTTGKFLRLSSVVKRCHAGAKLFYKKFS
jgi:O-phosphoseryl-tRNA(Cys) synthetase